MNKLPAAASAAGRAKSPNPTPAARRNKMYSYQKKKDSDRIVASYLSENETRFFRILVRWTSAKRQTFCLLYTPQCVGGIALLVDVPLPEIREALIQIADNDGPLGIISMAELFPNAAEIASLLIFQRKVLKFLTPKELEAWRRTALNAFNQIIFDRSDS